MKMFITALFLLIGVSSQGFAIENLDCDNADKAHPACNLVPIGGDRCTAEDAIKWNCKQPGAANPTLEATCNRVGGCFGSTNSGLWFTFKDPSGTVRCRCGCFAEETVFETVDGPLLGGEMPLLTSYPLLLASDSLEFGNFLSREALNVISGPEKEMVYVLTTATGERITITRKHPVVIASASGQFEKMITADQVQVGDSLVQMDGSPTSVVSVKKTKYHGKVVNFDLRGEKPEHHIVVANGIKMGDNVWQQRLAKVEGRMLDRDDLIMELSEPTK
ncbi:MAG: hypothetical protein CL429_01840 [Acidimicrobiaceae bacterium]|nr:hypothetical protein [Acidimicrobiaceae bacterium]